MPEILETNVKIKADASSLKQEANESIDALDRLQAKYEEVSAELSRAFANNGKAAYISSLTEQRNELLHIINDIKSGAIELSQIDLGKFLGQGVDTSGVENVKEKVDEVNNSLDETKHKQDQINRNWDTSGINSLLKGVKRIAASIMGVTTIFSVIRKSMNQYLSQNDALRQKLNGIYYAIGSMLAPILEWMVNLFAKIVLYVNAFLKGLGFAGIQFKNISNSAKKTQKTLRTLIAGFDELNTLQKANTDESDNTLTDPFADVKVNQEWIEKLQKLGEKLRPFVEWLWEKLKALFNWVLEHINLVIAAIGVILAIGLIKKIADIVNALGGVWSVLSTIGSAIITFLTSPLGGVILIIGGLVAAVAAFVDMWKNGWNIIGEIIKDIGIALVAVGAVILGAPATVAAVVAAIAAVLSTLVIIIHEHWDEISAWLAQTWANIKEAASVAWTNIKNTVAEINKALCTWLENTWTGFKEWVTELWTRISEIADSIWTALKENVKKIVTELHNALTQLWTNIKNTAVNMWNNISSLVTNIMNGIKNFFINAWNTIYTTVVNINNAIASAVRNIWNGLVNTIKGAINGILGFINGMIRGVVNGINSVISVLNKFHVTIPSWVPGFGGKSFGFNLSTINAPQVAYLAKGGIIDSPTLAMMGEYPGARNNPEIAVPQNVLQEMMESNNAELVSAFAAMTSQIISAINSVDMEVTIGDDTIARSAARGNNVYRNLTGKSLI